LSKSQKLSQTNTNQYVFKAILNEVYRLAIAQIKTLHTQENLSDA